MKLLLDPLVFQTSNPRNEKYLSDYWVQPTVLPALLNSDSCLLAAPNGYGKSTLVLLAQRATRQQWLNVNLTPMQSHDDDFTETLLRQITQQMWQYIEATPAALANLQTRAAAVRYFLSLFSDVDIDYLLTCLIDDYPEHQAVLQAFHSIQPRELFSATATATQKLSILCDCVQKLGLQGVTIWLDVSQELKQIPLPFLALLENLFDSLYLMRRKTLHIKCLAPPSVCHYLQQLRGVQTLSVAMSNLSWRREELQRLLDRRLAIASGQQIQTLAQLVEPDKFVALLTNSADVNNPVEWLTLMQMIAEVVNQQPSLPLSEQAWLSIQRAYYTERVKIRLDERGSFWRGSQLLSELTPKKRAIYPLVRYLYENPGIHRTYHLTKVLDVDEPNLNTIISRARKDHLEPFVIADSEEAWIYLVTDFKGGGYQLKHTDHSP
jgi:hypothetical protein